MTDAFGSTWGIYRRQYSGYIKGKRINEISLAAEAWFWRINGVVDDFGNVEADPALLYNATVGRRRGVNVDDVAGWIEEMAQAPLIRFYEADGERFLHIVGFCQRQPAWRNGRRVHRVAPSPWDSVESEPSESPKQSEMLKGENFAKSKKIQNVPGESKSPQENPVPIDINKREILDKENTGAAHLVPSDDDTGAVEKDSVPPGFGLFWQTWPAHFRKRGRTKCLRHWQRHKLEPKAQAILASLSWFKTSEQWQREGGQFVPLPLTWLNQTPWETDSAERVDAPVPQRTFSWDDFEAAPLRSPTAEDLAVAFGTEQKL